MLQCVRNIDPAQLGDALADGLRADLSSHEQQSLVAILESDAGRMMIGMMERLAGDRGMARTTTTTVTLTAAGTREYLAWMGMPVIDRLMRLRFVPNVLEAQARYRAALFQRCAPNVEPEMIGGRHPCTRPMPPYHVGLPPGQQASASVRFTTDPDGFVRKAAIVTLSGNEAMDFEAVRSVYSMRCAPVYQDGQRIAFTAIQPWTVVAWQDGAEPSSHPDAPGATVHLHDRSN